MTLVWASLVVVAAAAIGIAAMLLVRRRAPEGSYFADGDRAAGVFGVLATGFAILAGFVVVLAFQSYDDSRSGGEAEARIVSHQFESTKRTRSTPSHHPATRTARRSTNADARRGYWRAIATRSSSSGSSRWSASTAASSTSISTQLTSPVKSLGTG
jgi:hypothetical protein